DILLSEFPDSQHASDTMYFVAQSHQAVAHYRDAAARFEEFAGKYNKDKRAADALQNAYLFRLGIGDEEAAAADLKQYDALFKKKDIKTAAKIFWSRHDLLKTDPERKSHAEEYLKIYGSKGGVDRQIVAEAAIAQILWRRSCEEELLYDSCLSIKRQKAVSGLAEIEKQKKLQERQARLEAKSEKSGKKEKYKPPKRCGSSTQGLITVHKRDKKVAEQAQKRFANVLKLAKKNPQVPADD